MGLLFAAIFLIIPRGNVSFMYELFENTFITLYEIGIGSAALIICVNKEINIKRNIKRYFILFSLFF